MGINEFIKIGSRIKELRISKGISQKDMAEKLEINRSTYSNYENDIREPNKEIIEKIANTLNVEINELLPYHITIGGESTLPPELKQLDKSSNDISNQILSDLKMLNTKGKYEAAKRVNELTKLEEYTKEGE